ncbi:MAG: vWA domain-containing protein [Bacillota bacterium]
MSLPGGELSKRELHFVWLTDCSGSMSVKGKIQSLNNAISEAIPEMKKVAEENPNAEILIRALKFSGGAQWHIKDPIQVDDFMWNDLEAGGVTDLGQALSMLSEELEASRMPDQGLPPVLVLVSDGQPTDDFEAGLDKLLSLPWGQKAVKIAIAIGDDADIDVLNKFIDNPELEVLQANNSEELTAYIKWASTEVVKSASTGSSEEVANKSDNVAIPSQPKPDDVDVKPDVDVF